MYLRTCGRIWMYSVHVYFYVCVCVCVLCGLYIIRTDTISLHGHYSESRWRRRRWQQYAQIRSRERGARKTFPIIYFPIVLPKSFRNTYIIIRSADGNATAYGSRWWQKQFFGSLNRKTALYILASAAVAKNKRGDTNCNQRRAYTPRTILRGQLAIR